jgi:uncharacterized protein
MAGAACRISPVMKMHLDTTAGAHRITGYGAGYVTVDETRLTRSLVVSPDELISDWRPQSIDELDEAALQVVAHLQPMIVLLGTGEAQRFPPSALLSPLFAQGIHITFSLPRADRWRPASSFPDQRRKPREGRPRRADTPIRRRYRPRILPFREFPAVFSTLRSESDAHAPA